MRPMTLQEITRATQGQLVMGDPFIQLASVSTDSRAVRRGDIFFALKGEKFDGHAYLEDVIKKGAALCVISQIPERLAVTPSCQTALIKVKDPKRALGALARAYREKYGVKIQRAGIAGSCGKTTVKDMLASILQETASTVFSQGNFNNEIGCPLSVLKLEPTHVYGVFEIGASAKGEVQRLSDIVAPHVAVITNVRLEHTETFGGLQDIAQGETEILSALQAGGTAVLPRDDDFFDYMVSRLPKEKSIKIMSFGFTDKAHVQAVDIATWPGPLKFSMVQRDDSGKILQKFSCQLPVLGQFNVLNACAAGAAALALGVPKEKIISGLARFSPSPMRFEILRLKNDITVVNDSYNSNPGSMRASVQAFVESFSNKRLCLVSGDMLELGEISSGEHEELGEFLAGFQFSKIIFYGSQSKFSFLGAKKNMVDPKTLVHCSDAAELLHAVEAAIQPGTAVLFKASRGMTLEGIVKKVTEHFV